MIFGVPDAAAVAQRVSDGGGPAPRWGPTGSVRSPISTSTGPRSNGRSSCSPPRWADRERKRPQPAPGPVPAAPARRNQRRAQRDNRLAAAAVPGGQGPGRPSLPPRADPVRTGENARLLAQADPAGLRRGREHDLPGGPPGAAPASGRRTARPAVLPSNRRCRPPRRLPPAGAFRPRFPRALRVPARELPDSSPRAGALGGLRLSRRRGGARGSAPGGEHRPVAAGHTCPARRPARLRRGLARGRGGAAASRCPRREPARR